MNISGNIDLVQSLEGGKEFMEYKDLVQRVGWGEEFLFEYHGANYWISQNANGRYLTRESDGYSQDFKTTYELFNNAKIEGKSILQIWDEIENQF